MPNYRTVLVALSIPSEDQEHAVEQATDIAKAQLSNLRADDTLLPIRASVNIQREQLDPDPVWWLIP